MKDTTHVEQENTAVTNADTEVLALTMTAGFISYIAIEVENVSGGTLNSFKVQIKTHGSGEWHTYVSDANFDSTTNSNLLFSSDTGPHEVAAAGFAAFIVRLEGVFAFRLLAKSASASVVSVRGTLSS